MKTALGVAAARLFIANAAVSRKNQKTDMKKRDADVINIIKITSHQRFRYNRG